MKKKLISILAAVLLVASGCNENILDVKNQSAYDDATYFTSATTFNEGIVAIYSCLLMPGLYSRDSYFIFDLLGGDATNNVFLLGDLAQLQDYSFGSSQPQLQALWRNLYRMVLRSNLMLDRLDTWDPTVPEEQELKKQFIGEARFLRGYANFMLVSLWGRVPLRLDYGTNIQDAPRAAVADVWRAVEADFNAAVTNLPVLQNGSNLGRVTRGAAVAMLGKSFLYQKKYPEAETELRKLLATPYNYSLDANYDNLFSSNNGRSSEVIFNVVHGPWQGWGVGNAFYMFGGQEAWGGRATHSGRAQEYGWNDWNNVFVSDALVGAFKYLDNAGQTYTDPRAKLTFYGDAASGGDTDFCQGCPPSRRRPRPVYVADTTKGGPFVYPFNSSNTVRYNWRKYCIYETREQSELPQSDINTILIRLADVKLMLAEAQIFQNKFAEALVQINDVRRRVGAFEYTSLGTQANAVTLLQRERQIELGGEQHRWFDLVRWGVAKQVLNAEKRRQLNREPFEDKHVLLPIPQLERDSNPLVNNDVANQWN
ncbi:MAG: RagB/SusD family nutrient uptake outer membrane protein [Cytophagales bacterium]|nr:RagB/SusD family nutrient uptake outer membrane protein [Cytophagales bacterium]